MFMVFISPVLLFISMKTGLMGLEQGSMFYILTSILLQLVIICIFTSTCRSFGLTISVLVCIGCSITTGLFFKRENTKKEQVIEQMEQHPSQPISSKISLPLEMLNEVRNKQIRYWEKEYKPLTNKEKKEGISEYRANLPSDWNKTTDKLQSKFGKYKVVGAKKVNNNGDYIIQVKPEMKDYSSIDKLS